MSTVFCNNCGHRNPPGANFCSSCGAVLDVTREDRTMVFQAIDSRQDAQGPQDDLVVKMADLPAGTGVLVVRSGAEPGVRVLLQQDVTRLGRHPDSDVLLDDITVSRRHAEVLRTESGYRVRDVGSLNGTYLNQERVDEADLEQGDELQVGKYRMVFLARPEGT